MLHNIRCVALFFKIKNMKKIVSVAIVLSATFHLNAQAEEADVKKNVQVAAAAAKEFKSGWTRGGFFNINASNTIFKNWAGGGSNSTGIVFNGSLYAVYKKGNGLWENYLDLNYGAVQNGSMKIDDPKGALDPNGDIKKINNPFVKADDRLVYQTKYGRKINDKINYAALFNLNTQMFAGYQADDKLRERLPVSDFLSQAFGYASLGVDYKPAKAVSVFVSPLTLKYTYVMNTRLAPSFGLDSNKNIRTEMGWYINTQVSKEIMKNVTIQSRLELFNNYKSVYLFKRIDINWQNTINLKVNKYINVSLITQMLYDDDVDVDPINEGKQMRAQWKHFSGIAFGIKFGDNLP